MAGAAGPPDIDRGNAISLPMEEIKAGRGGYTFQVVEGIPWPPAHGGSTVISRGGRRSEMRVNLQSAPGGSRLT